MDQIKCSHCQGSFSEADCVKYAKGRKRKDGSFKMYYHCRACNTARIKAYRKTTKGRSRIYIVQQKYAKKNPSKIKAWFLARIQKTLPCEVCGVTKSVHRHHDDYAKPLEVRFLCAKHHKDHHKKLLSQKV